MENLKFTEQQIDELLKAAGENLDWDNSTCDQEETPQISPWCYFRPQYGKRTGRVTSSAEVEIDENLSLIAEASFDWISYLGNDPRYPDEWDCKLTVNNLDVYVWDYNNQTAHHIEITPEMKYELEMYAN